MTGLSHDDHKLQTWTLLAFESACQRMLPCTEVDHQSYAATGEALYWACAADEGYSDLLGPKYKKIRDDDLSGNVLNGIRWARNRMTHQLAIVVERHYGTELGAWVLGAGALGTLDHLKWVTSQDIPPGRSDGGRDVYDVRLAGQPVEGAVEACREWLFGLTLNELLKGAGFAIGDLPGIPDLGADRSDD